jgi:predicted negative regulator of RcsB-dependent stress response
VAFILLLIAAPVMADDGPPWWNALWPYRARIDVAEGEGDVAIVRLRLGGRTTDDARDVRVVDMVGVNQSFNVLHHDPRKDTVLQVKVPADHQVRYWVYFGNERARPLFDPQRDVAEVRMALARWREAQHARRSALARRNVLTRRLGLMRGALVEAESSGRWSAEELEHARQRIADMQDDIEQIYVPPEMDHPEITEPWQPRRGLTFVVHRKPRQEHPKTLADLLTLIKISPTEGAALRTSIADGFNPFGQSDHYISVYDGYLHIETEGEYAFCSASDDGSWIVVNDHELLAWPGPHGWGGSQRGEKHGKITLKPGVAHVRYYHEEGDSNQLAYLGWKPPGSEAFVAIPPAQWVPAREGQAVRFEAYHQPVMAVADPRVLHTWWVRDSDEQQASLVEFTAVGVADDEALTAHWRFGDGLEADGAKVTHVYFHTEPIEAALTVSNDQNRGDTVTFEPPVFKVDVQTAAFGYGKEDDYVAAVREYDMMKMARRDLLAYIAFWKSLEQYPDQLRAARAFVERFAEDEAFAQTALDAAGAMLEPTVYEPAEARQLLELAVQRAADPAVRRRVTLRLAQVLTWDADLARSAKPMFEQLLDMAEDKPFRRQCLIGLGDVALLTGDNAEAHRRYEMARDLGERAATQAEEMAKRGGYPYTVEDLLGRGEYDWALKTIDEWEDQFPTQKLEGYSLFLRGKTLFVQQPSPLAVRYLALSERVDPYAVHIPEAVWLRANCLMAIGEYEQAAIQFARIRDSFTQSQFFEQAMEKFKQCQQHLGNSPS